jgi:crotonobetainyl-CoA:carnitine CoA-transferase CaiB-like acyl-CoA transferase
MEQALTGTRVVEVGGGYAAPMAGKLLADLGAAVVKVEPPEGDPARRHGPFPAGVPNPEASGAFIALNANKRSLVLDLGAAPGRRALEALAAEADILLHDLPPRAMEAAGLDYARLAARNPRLVLLSITPYGLTGPYRDFAASDLTLIHGGGFAYLCPDGSPHADRPPLRFFGHHALLQAGLHGATAALAAHLRAGAQGIGEHIDLSIHSTVGLLLGRHFPAYSYQGKVESRLTQNITAPSNLFPCKDGVIYLIAVEDAQWERLVEMMGQPDWTRSPLVADRAARGQNQDYLTEHLSRWTAQWTAEELFHACQKNRIGAAPVYDFDRIASDPHLAERAFFVPHEHPVAGRLLLPGSPYRLRQPWWALRTPAPRLGEANGLKTSLFGGPALARTVRAAETPPGGPAPSPAAPDLPLRGVRVLDLTWVWAGPHATLLLAYLGAEVLKVESAARADLARRLDIYPQGMAGGLNRCGYFNTVGQAKQSVAINVSHPEGLALVKQLAARSDVVMSNFATGVMDRLGLAADVLQRTKPDLIVAAISAFGQTGPYRDYSGYGPLIPPVAGLCAQTGYEEDGLPVNERIAYADPNAGVYAAFAILAALRARKPGRPGQVIDVSLWEPMLATAFEGWMNHVLGGEPHRPEGNHDPRHAPHNTYRCRGDDAWVAVAVTDDAQWQGLARALARPDLAQDARYGSAAGRKRHEGDLDAVLSAWCAGRERWEVTRALQAQGVPAFPCLSSRDLAEDPHLAERGLFSRGPHPEVGPLQHVGIPWRLERAPNAPPPPAPLLGEHTDRVLRAVLGLEDARIMDLRRAGAIE